MRASLCVCVCVRASVSARPRAYGACVCVSGPFSPPSSLSLFGSCCVGYQAETVKEEDGDIDVDEQKMTKQTYSAWRVYAAAGVCCGTWFFRRREKTKRINNSIHAHQRDTSQT